LTRGHRDTTCEGALPLSVGQRFRSGTLAEHQNNNINNSS
jgi:hypothetical protein